MNRVELIGRLTKDPELRYTKENIAVASFTLAINRPKVKDKEQETDFINCKVFNKQAENLKKYCTKGKLIAVDGTIRTGSYEKDGQKYYTTEIIAQNIEFLSSNTNSQEEQKNVEIVPQNKSSNALNDEVFANFGNSIEIDNFDDDGVAF